MRTLGTNFGAIVYDSELGFHVITWLEGGVPAQLSTEELRDILQSLWKKGVVWPEESRELSSDESSSSREELTDQPRRRRRGRGRSKVV